jgi:phosphatidylinositol kinase/protein kinase (PI-3  family)
LALKTVGSLRPPAWSLLQLLQGSIAPYLRSDNKDLRKEAAITCVKMITNSPFPSNERSNSAAIIEEIVNRLVEMIIADPSAEVRIEVIRCLPESFDHFLCRQHHIESLTFLLAEESFEIKLEALKMLGRLSNLNPASTLPSLRLFLTRLISELNKSSDNRLKEEAASLVSHFMRAMALQPVVKAYLGTLIRSLPLDQRDDVRLTSASLEAIGDICLVMREDTLPYTDRLLSVVIENMRDSSTRRKQEISLKTLGQLVSATGFVVRPYLSYPQLLPWILDLLFRNSSKASWSLRREALRTLGLLGALEPRKYSMIVSHLQTFEKQKDEKSEENALSEGFLPQPLPSAASKLTILAKTKERADSISALESSEKEYQINGDTAVGASPLGDELIQSEVLLDEDNADRPSYLFMYEQCAFHSLSEPTSIESPRLLPSSDEYYPQVALLALMKILRDSSLTVHHSSVAQTIVSVFRSLQLKCVGYLDPILPYMLKMIRRSGSGLQESLLQQISVIINIAGIHIVPFLPQIFETICDYWNEHMEQVLVLVQEISTASGEAFAAYLPQLLPLILSSLSLPQSLLTSATAATLPPEPNSSQNGRSNATIQQQILNLQVQYSRTFKNLEQTLRCCNVIRLLIRPHIPLFVPTLCKVIEQIASIVSIIDGYRWLILAVKTLRHVTTSARGNVIDQTNASVTRIIHTLTDAMFILSTSNNYHYNQDTTITVINECIDTIIAVGKQLGPRFVIFDGLVKKSIESVASVYQPVISTAAAANAHRLSDMHTIHVASYQQLSSDLRFGRLTDFGYGDLADYFGSGNHSSSVPNPVANNSDEIANDFEFVGSVNRGRGGPMVSSMISKHAMNQAQLAKAWDVSQRTTANDWNEWLRRLRVDLIRESPSPVIRSCAALSQSYPPLAHDLFHAAFVSCWQELSEPFQESLVRALQAVFRSNSIPPEILQTLLNLAEFMEHDVEALPISLSILAELAQKSRAYAKALHYRELEFQLNPVACFESLININKKLDQYDAAVGVVSVVKKMQLKQPELRDSLTVQDSWLAKLGYWEEALEQYDRRLSLNPNDAVSIAGKLKCLESLGRWEEAIHICRSSLDLLRISSAQATADSAYSNIHTKAAVIGARAAWSLSEWQLMDEFVSNLADDNVDGSFMRAVLSTHKGDFTTSEKLIDHTRKQLDASISALLSESYGRAYLPLVLVQQCSELEEIIEYKKLARHAASADSMESSQIGGASSHAPSTAWRTISNRKQQTMASLSATIDVGIPDAGVAAGEGSMSSSLPPMLSSIQQQVSQHKIQLANKWRKRLQGCYSSGKGAIPFWKHLLNGHRLVLHEREDLDMWLELASLCRNTGNLKLSERILTMSSNMLSSSISNTTAAAQELMERKVRLALLEQQWTMGDRLDALVGLDSLIKQSVGDSSPGRYAGDQRGQYNEEDANVQLNCILKLGQWKLSMIEPGASVDPNTRREVLQLYHRATMVDPNSYSAWHQWGLSNYRAIEEARGKTGRFVNPRHSIGSLLYSPSSGHHRSLPPPPSASINKPPIDSLLPYVVNAVKGLLRAISLGTRRWSSSVTQDMLCVLTIWFKYGKHQEVFNALESCLNMCHVDNWLGVLPQLIARIDHADALPRQLLHSLLAQLGTRHAQALVFPLSVAIKSPKQDRIEAAQGLMSRLRQNSARIIDQALLVSQELVRVAIVWEEMWHESLEEASRQYFGDGNVAGMIDTLAPLYTALETGPATIFEATFCQQFGRELMLAWSFVKKYKNIFQASGKPLPTSGAAPVRRPKDDPAATVKSLEAEYLNSAWEQYYQAFQNINKKLTTITSLELQFCSPELLNARDLEVGVPGTYTVNGSAVRIRAFIPTIAIIKSKQRPRKLKILGEDGRSFLFLLKGHEDLRQDERAMQLFGLVNALLVHDRSTNHESHNLTIERYAVIPLSPTAGLISWVPNCDTLHDLIREYRDTRRIILNVEHKLMQQLSPPTPAGYDLLTLMQKLEIFEYALQNTTGEDLAKILWLKSDTSEAWLQRRLSYTRSLAVMSMVGYILGLGDRHPSNLMLNRDTGKVLHIDFGDCFEIAMHREKFPERVPFRLTRMLVNAMEVSGIEGNYRLTCEKVMMVLRENRDSLVAILEAFVYDPLISWRLLNTNLHDKAATTAAVDGGGGASHRPAAVSEKAEDNMPAVVVPAIEADAAMGALVDGGASASIRLETIYEDASIATIVDADADTGITPTTTTTLAAMNHAHPPTRTLRVGRDAVAVLDPDEEAEQGHGSTPPPPAAAEADLPPFESMHLAMSYLAQSLSHSPSMRAAGSVYRPSLRQMSLAQRNSLASVGREQQPSSDGTRSDGLGGEDDGDAVSEKAVTVIRRVVDKLTGLDFTHSVAVNTSAALALDVPNQVDRLISEAMANENLCRSFIGWCPFW